MQKIRLAFRGWQRRREDSDRDFLARNAAWGASLVAPPKIADEPKAVAEIDIEGLQVAYLDDSGRLEHYLDMDTWEIVEADAGASMPAPRYRRIPQRSGESDAEDRKAFLSTCESSAARDRLAQAVNDADAFRRALAADRALERSWYNFKNDRSLAAVKAWLDGLQ